MFFVLFNVVFLLLLKHNINIHVWLVALLELDTLHFLYKASIL